MESLIDRETMRSLILQVCDTNPDAVNPVELEGFNCVYVKRENDTSDAHGHCLIGEVVFGIGGEIDPAETLGAMILLENRGGFDSDACSDASTAQGVADGPYNDADDCRDPLPWGGVADILRSAHGWG